MNKLPFYKEKIYLGRLCKVCGTEYKARKGGVNWGLRLCALHRRQWWREHYYKFDKAWRLNHKEYRAMQYQVWKKWVTENIERRQLIALNSYHKRKHDPRNKARKHRATQKPV